MLARLLAYRICCMRTRARRSWMNSRSLMMKKSFAGEEKKMKKKKWCTRFSIVSNLMDSSYFPYGIYYYCFIISMLWNRRMGNASLLYFFTTTVVVEIIWKNSYRFCSLIWVYYLVFFLIFGYVLLRKK